MSEDTTKIPPGNYCYRVYPLRNGEILSHDLAKFGRSLREYSYNKGFKEMLCPYWQRTNYGTIKCLFTKTECLDTTQDNSLELLVSVIGEKAAHEFPTNWRLEDEIKICGINEDQDDPWAYDT
jgi:hypothetical protein